MFFEENSGGACGQPYLLDVLALKLGNELVEAVGVSLNTDRLEDGLDVGSGGAGVATEAEEEVGSEVLHFCGCCRMSVIAEANERKVQRADDGSAAQERTYL